MDSAERIWLIVVPFWYDMCFWYDRVRSFVQKAVNLHLYNNDDYNLRVKHSLFFYICLYTRARAYIHTRVFKSYILFNVISLFPFSPIIISRLHILVIILVSRHDRF